ncbi:hypothetical protein, partial [Endozoicomonas sp. ONNA2]|uniref:hypothetical protein n=1 Tax=Endozoicomonas sp. ONNA2 TaxID=2828741 RepID=UPI0021484348
MTTPLNIKSPEPVGTETHRKMRVTRADLSAPLPNQSDKTESANRESSRPPTADADPYLGVKDGDLTASLVRDIKGGVPNRANFFRNSAVLLHDVATGPSTARSQPPIGQETGIIPPIERFWPIRSGANIAGAVTAGLNPKAPVQGGARSLRSDIKKQRMDPSALAYLPGLVRITEAQISSIIRHLEKYFPNMDTHAKDMIRRGIGAIPLTAEQIDAACHGGRDSLEEILRKCQLLDSKLSDKANTGRQLDVESPVGPAGSSSNFHHLSGGRKHIKGGFVAGPGPTGVLPGVRATADQAGRGINDSRQAVVMEAGIQA